MPNFRGLPAGHYVVIDPTHIDGDDGRVFDAIVDAVVPGEGVYLDYVAETGRKYRLYVFRTAYGAGTFPLWVGDHCAGHVDTDDGFIAVVPLDLVLDCGSDYTKWLVVCNENQFTALFQLENTYKPSFENGVFILDDIVLDTTDLSFVPEEDRTIVEERIRNLEPDQYLGREMTAYLVMHAMFLNAMGDFVPH